MEPTQGRDGGGLPDDLGGHQTTSNVSSERIVSLITWFTLADGPHNEIRIGFSTLGSLIEASQFGQALP